MQIIQIKFPLIKIKLYHPIPSPSLILNIPVVGIASQRH
jgi:hypothetical protein